MGRERIVYQDWIVELGRDPSLTWEEHARPAGTYNRTIIGAVNKALNNLDEAELMFIRSFYLQGMSYRDISDMTGRAMSRLESIHAKALKKLKRRLYKLLRDRYTLPSPHDSNCPLCRHPRVEEINDLIRSKKQEQTWKKIMRVLRSRFDIGLKTPQRLIGHQKYHMT